MTLSRTLSADILAPPRQHSEHQQRSFTMTKPNPGLALVSALTCVLLLQACIKDQPTAPGMPRSLPGSTGFKDEVVSEQTIPLASAFKTDSGSVITLPNFPYETLVRITASGSLHASVVNVNHVPPDHDFDFGPGGFFNGQLCKVKVYATFQQGGNVNFGCTGADTGSTAVKYLVVRNWTPGYNTARRDVPLYPLGTCAPAPQLACHSYSGSQSIKIERIVADLQLTATPNYVAPSGDSVTFVASVTPSAAGGVNVPWEILSWSWLADDNSVTGISSYCAYNNSTCRRKITKSGTMTVVARVNGVTQTKSVHVSLNCVTSDSILNNDNVRKALMDALRDSGVDSTSDKRKERGGWIQRRSDGSYVVQEDFSYSDGCGITLNIPPTVTAGLTPVARWGTHPTRTGETLYDCGFTEYDFFTNPPTIKRSQQVKPSDSFGASDWQLVGPIPQMNGQAFPVYKINADGDVFRLDPPAPPDWKTQTPQNKRWRWDQPGCTWQRSS